MITIKLSSVSEEVFDDVSDWSSVLSSDVSSAFSSCVSSEDSSSGSSTDFSDSDSFDSVSGYCRAYLLGNGDSQSNRLRMVQIDYGDEVLVVNLLFGSS